MAPNKQSVFSLEEYFLNSRSPAFRKVLVHAEQVAQSSANILLTGESGVGKEVIARYIHSLSPRRDAPFVAVNCTSYSDTLLNSELFGHEQGAFTGAVKSRSGKFELANRGTLFLDEIGDVDHTTQVMLLRAIETKIIERIGGNEQRKIDFRLISATNRDLRAEIIQKRFREDFFYRVSTIVIDIPPLRERADDYADLIAFFTARAEQENGIKVTRITENVRRFMLEYDYPGNLREMKNLADRMVVLSRDGVVDEDCLPVLFGMGHKTATRDDGIPEFSEIIPLREFHENTEKRYLRWVLEQTGGNASEAARRLALSSRQMYNKIREYGLRETP